MLELFGYLASIVTAASLTMSSLWRLRWFNLCGSGMLMAYAMAVRTWPVAVVNAFIVVTDAYHLWRLHFRKETFGLVEVPSWDMVLLKPFLDAYRADIAKFFPGFSLSKVTSPRCIFILRDLAPAGLFIYEDEGHGTARIHVDYVTPLYRDLTSARFLFNNGHQAFIQAGFREFVVRNPSLAHARYCRRMGFSPSAVNSSAWVKSLASGRDINHRSRGASASAS